MMWRPILANIGKASRPRLVAPSVTAERQGKSDVTGVAMVYDADGGLQGELAYVWNKLRGAHCALCDITHGIARAKPGFEELTRSLGVPVEVLHRNEQDPELAEFTAGIEPVVVARTSDGPLVLMDSASLDRCGGELDTFARELRTRIEAATRS